MRLIRFNPQAEHVPGKQMVVADTLSRNPPLSEQEPLTAEDVQAFVDSVESTKLATDTQLERIRESSRQDAQLQKVMDGQQEWKTSHTRFESSLFRRDTCQ